MSPETQDKPFILTLFFKDEEKLIESIVKRDDSIHGLASSLERFDMMAKAPEMKKMGIPLRLMTSILRATMLSYTSIKKNPKQPKATIDEHLLHQFEEQAKILGVDALGYAKLPQELIFRDMAVLYDSVIVLLRKMDKEKVDSVPSEAAKIMFLETYNDLGRMTNKLAKFLRRKGFCAQAGHPLGGQTIYPALVELAGLGWHGRHGLIITPEFGPRVRISALYTNISNLPFSEHNNHTWIEDYCATCGRCIMACPSQAIYEKPIHHQNNLITHVDGEKCFECFLNNQACSICIKECPFNTNSYLEIRKSII